MGRGSFVKPEITKTEFENIPEVSVIVPVYNIENKIRRCIESLINQTFTDFELILVDDGSTDTSGSICDDYGKKDNRIKVLHKKNGGVSSARNAGIDCAKGKYVVFADSDDWAEKEYIEALVNAIRENNQLSICGICYISDFGTNKILQRDCGDFTVEFSQADEKLMAKLIEDRRFNYLYAKAYSRKILNDNKIRFNEDMTLGEDTVFVMDYLMHINAVKIIGKAYYNYVQYGEGTLKHRFYKDVIYKFTFINNYIIKTMKYMNLYGNSVQKAIDQRQLYGFNWAVSDVIGSNLTRKQKLAIIENIVNVPELQEALCKNPGFFESQREYRAIQKKSASKLINHYKRRKIEKWLVEKFKLVVVTVVPKSVIRKVKQWI